MVASTDRGSPVPLDPHEAEYRARLQLALGNDYALSGLIGLGGMGAVYVARDCKLDRDVAVKTLRADVFPSRLVIERFQREAKALAKLRHPNILPVYAVGEGDGLTYMVTPRIDGLSLREAIDRDGPLPIPEAIRIASEIARALDAAHRLGIIHRDIKPDNILLEGAGRHALLADFGIAKSASEDSALTASGMMVGSPRYMSPEQLDSGDEIDHRADLYALGAVLYEMLSGRPCFDGDTLHRLVVQKMTSDPPPLETVAKHVPASTVAIVMRCLAREPRDRWSSAVEIERELLREKTAETTVAPRASWLERRGPIVFLLSLVLIYLSAGATILSRAESGPAIDFVMNVIVRPLRVLIDGLLALIVLESVVVFFRAPRGGETANAVIRVLGQPRWWLTWYPRRLRSRGDLWETMSFGTRGLRTIVFVELIAIPLAVPLVYLVPLMVPAAQAADVALPATLRLLVAVGIVVRAPLLLLLGVFVGCVAVASIRRRASPITVIRDLITPVATTSIVTDS